MPNFAALSTDELAQLTTLAERLSSEGQMNLNKLTEAIVYAQVRRAGWLHRPLITNHTMQQELETAIQMLRQQDAFPALVQPMESGAQAMAQNSDSDLSSAELPDVFVCRKCGYAVLGQPPDRCPDCGSWAHRFRKFVSIFNHDNEEPINPFAVLKLMADNAQALEQLVSGLSEEVMQRKPDAENWSSRDLIAHFYDTQEMLDTRISLMLEHDNPPLVSLAVYELAEQADRHPPTARGTLDAFLLKRRACIARLEALPLKDLWRTGEHPEFGQLTILRQVTYNAYHEHTHLPDIEWLRDKFTDPPA